MFKEKDKGVTGQTPAATQSAAVVPSDTFFETFLVTLSDEEYEEFLERAENATRELPGVVKALKEVSELVKTADSIIVENEEEYEGAGEVSAKIKDAVTEIQKTIKGPKSRLHSLHGVVSSTEREIITPLNEAAVLIGDKQSAWYKKKKREEEIERQNAEAARLKAEQDEKEKLHKKAERNEERRPEVAALYKEAEETYVQPPSTPPTIKKTIGKTTMTSDIAVEIKDEKKVLKAIIDGKLPIGAVKILLNTIKTHIKNMKYDAAECKEYGLQVTEIFNPKATKKSR